MSILIRGMEMPKTCEECTLESYCSLWVDARRLSDDGKKAKIRHPDCPLVPVPAHGRLIDADALKNSLSFAESTARWAVPALRAVLMVIDEMPTIIPAEESEI